MISKIKFDNIDEESILLVHPTAVISAHVKNERITATTQINANPEILSVGNIPAVYEFSGELAMENGLIPFRHGADKTVNTEFRVRYVRSQSPTGGRKMEQQLGFLDTVTDDIREIKTEVGGPPRFLARY